MNPIHKMLTKPIRAVMVASAAVALAVGGVAIMPAVAQATPSAPAPVITGPDSNGYCYTQTPITQNEYVKVIPGHAETTHNEYTYKQVTTVYTVEHKQITIPASGRDHDSLLTWLNKIGAVDKGNNNWQLPDALVNAAGVKVVGPGAVAPSGNVSMAVYGGPNITVHYQITSIDVTTSTPPTGLYVTNHNVTLYYTGSGVGSTNSADAVYTATNPGSPWVQFGNVKVVGNGDAVPDSLVFYLPGGGQDSIKPNADKSADDPHWTTDALPSGWTLYATRDSSTKTKVTCPPAKEKDCVITDPVWKAEPGDIPATLENDGYHFDAATTPTSAQDIYQRATGNMQGIHNITANYDNVHGKAALVVVEVSPNEVIPGGTSSSYSTYATISSASPVVNGVNNVQDGLWYTSRIQYGQPGGQGNPVTWQQMIVLMPNNSLLSPPSLHKETNATTSDTSTVKSLSSSCGSFNFVTTVDGAKPTATITSSCMATAPGTTIPAKSEVTVKLSNPYTGAPGHVGTPAEFRISVDGGVAKDVGTIQPGGADVTITSAQDSELSFPAGSGQHTVVVKSNQLGAIANATVNADDCNVAVTPVAPTPAVNNVCTKEGQLNKGHTESLSDLQKAQPAGIVMTVNKDGVSGSFTAAPGYVLKAGSVTTFNLGTVGGPTTCAKTLALTGLDIGTWVVLGLIGVVGGIWLRIVALRRRRGMA